MATRRKAPARDAVQELLLAPLLDTGLGAAAAELKLAAADAVAALASDDTERLLRGSVRAFLVANASRVLAALAERATTENTAAKLFLELLGVTPLPSVPSLAGAEADLNELGRSVLLAMRRTLSAPVGPRVELPELGEEEALA